MRYSSGSHTSGASPFCKRAVFVLSKARLSISVAWLSDGDADAVAGEATTRRGREAGVLAPGNESKRAAGNTCGVCAETFWLAESKTIKRITNEMCEISRCVGRFVKSMREPWL